MFRAQNFSTAATSVFPKILSRAMEVDGLGQPQSGKCIEILSVRWDDPAATTFRLSDPENGPCAVATVKTRTGLLPLLTNRFEVMIVAHKPAVDLDRILTSKQPAYFQTQAQPERMFFWFDNLLKDRTFSTRSVEKDGVVIYHVKEV